MKNTMKKSFWVLVFAVLAAGGVFAQRVGDTVQLGGQTYAVESVSGNRVVLQKVLTLDGRWESNGGTFITISGGTGVYTQFGNVPDYFRDAINKGMIKIGSQIYRSLRKTGDLTWTGEEQFVRYNLRTNAAASTNWQNAPITMAADGNTFQCNGTTWTRK
jgi:hypothetical protein